MNKKNQQFGGKLSFGMTAMLVVVLAVGTFIERSKGTAFAFAQIWHAPWFFGLLGVIVFCSIIGLSTQRHKPSIWGIHIAFIIILSGAALTHFSGQSGKLHLRKGQSTELYADETRKNHVKHLPFTVKLKDFQIIYHEKKDIPKNFISTLEIQETGKKKNRKTDQHQQTPNIQGSAFYTTFL